MSREELKTICEEIKQYYRQFLNPKLIQINRLRDTPGSTKEEIDQTRQELILLQLELTRLCDIRKSIISSLIDSGLMQPCIYASSTTKIVQS